MGPSKDTLFPWYLLPSHRTAINVLILEVQREILRSLGGEMLSGRHNRTGTLKFLKGSIWGTSGKLRPTWQSEGGSYRYVSEEGESFQTKQLMSSAHCSQAVRMPLIPTRQYQRKSIRGYGKHPVNLYLSCGNILVTPDRLDLLA